MTRPLNLKFSDRWLLPPLALWTTFSSALVGRHSHDYYDGSVTISRMRGR
jgi:hypothetical protein